MEEAPACSHPTQEDSPHEEPDLNCISDNLEYLSRLIITTAGAPAGELVCLHPVAQGRSRPLAVPRVDATYHPHTQTASIEVEANWGPSASASSSCAESIQSHKEGWTVQQIRKFPHDFTFGIFTTRTDFPLSHYFEVLDDHCNNLTPDMILSGPDGMIILEFSTNAGGYTPEVLMRAHHTKLFKYKAALERRIDRMPAEEREGKYFIYMTMVVSDTYVLSGVELPTFLVDELCARHCFSKGIQVSLFNQGLPRGGTEKDCEKEGIKAMIGSVKANYAGPEVVRGMSRAVIDTVNDSPEVCLEYASLAYRISLLKSTARATDADKSVRVKDRVALRIYKEESEGTRTDMKSVVQIPGILPPLGTDSLPVPNVKTDGLMFRVWNAAMSDYTAGGAPKEMSEEDAIKMAEMPSDHPLLDAMKTDRASYKRVMVDNLLEDDRVLLAKVGIDGKKMSSVPEVQNYRAEKKESFSWTVDRSDIEDFLLREEVRVPVPISLNQEVTFQAIKRSFTSYKEPNYDGILSMEDFLNSSVYQYCDMVTDIGIEVSVSLKQNCKRDQYIMKKLRNRDLWLLIKPTNSSAHIFVSFMWMNKGTIEVFPDPVFKKVIQGENYSCTEFISFNASKLVNIVKCGPAAIASFAQWIRFYELKDQRWPGQGDFWYMFKMLLLIHLEDKSSTEAVLSMMRYICMEKFAERNMQRTKCLEKFPEFYRSRLSMWAAEKLMKEMVSKEYGYAEAEGELGKGEWENVRNPYTGSIITDPGQLIELFYMGYAKNKDEVPSANVEFQLVRKIIKYEQLLETSNPEYFGLSSPKLQVTKPIADALCFLTEGVHYEVVEDMDFDLGTKNHEWARLSNCAAADAFKGMMHKAYGTNWEEIMEDRILERWHKLTWEDLATLKSSSTYDPKEGKEWKDGKVKTSRVKAIIAVLGKGNMLEGKPYKSLLEVTQWLEDSGGLIVDLFKKMQHVSLREIYVLHIQARIAQLFFEEMSRALASFMEMELMMHPTNKIRLPQAHIREAEQAKQPFKQNICASNDAAVWNQLHHVNKFAQFLCRILPPHFHDYVVKTMMLWLNKRMAIPDGVLNLLKAKPSTRFKNPIDGMFSDAYRGIITRSWLKPGSQHLEIESGMMQGILHYTSSVFHASVLTLRDNIFRSLMKARGIRVLTTDMVSSDDSGRMIEILAQTEESLQEGVAWGRMDIVAMISFSWHFGINLSLPKSTMMTQKMFEINSEFFNRASLYRPILKWLLSLLNIVEVESVYGRQEVMGNLLTGLLEAGAGFYQVSMCQFAQAVMHYKLMGSSVSSLWERFITALTEIQDPSLGYFLMDEPRAAGLFGFNFNFYCACMANPGLSCRLATQMTQEVMTTTSTGSLVRGVQIRYGNRKKAYKIIEAATKQLPNWKELVEEDPRIIYQQPKSRDDLVCRILSKLTGPNVTTSLSKSNSVSRMISSAVYIVGMHATSIGTAWMDFNDELLRSKGEKDRIKKVSLWYLMRQKYTGPGLSKEQKDLLFPLANQYESCVELMAEIGKLPYCKGGSRRRLRTQISVYPEALSLPYSLEEIVRWKWFQNETVGSDKMLREVWSQYKLRLSWLRDCPKETLKASPYETQLELRNVIARDAPRYRVVHLTGSPIAGSGTRDLVSSALIRNQFPGLSLIGRDEVFRFRVNESIKQALHAAATICTFPLTDKEARRCLDTALARLPQIWMGDPQGPSPRVMRLACIQMYIKLARMLGLMRAREDVKWRKKQEVQEVANDYHPEVLQRRKALSEMTLNVMLETARLGVVGGFTKPQVWKDGKWQGKGGWLGRVGGMKVHILMEDRAALHITVDSLEKLSKEHKLLNQLLRELDLETVERSLTPGDCYFEGKIPNFEGRGTPVSRGLLEVPEELSIQDMRVTVKGGNIRLVCALPTFGSSEWRRTSQAREVTIASFRVNQGDFDWNAHTYEPTRQTLLIPWSKNQPEKVPILSLLLRDIWKGDAFYALKGLDLERFIEFCRVGIQPRLYAAGWIEKGRQLLHIPVVDPEAPDDIEDWGIEYEMDEELLGKMMGAPEKDAIVDIVGPDFGEPSNLQDFEFRLIESQKAIGDIRRSHLFFKNFVDRLSSIGKREKAQILRGIRPTAITVEIMDIINFYENVEKRVFVMQQPQEPEDVDPERYSHYL